MTKAAKKTPEQPAERTCPACGGPYDQVEADAYIPVCVACQRKQSSTPTGRKAKLTR